MRSPLGKTGLIQALWLQSSYIITRSIARTVHSIVLVANCFEPNERDLGFIKWPLGWKKGRGCHWEKGREGGRRVGHHVEKQAYGNHWSAGIHTRHTGMHYWGESKQYSAVYVSGEYGDQRNGQ